MSWLAAIAGAAAIALGLLRWLRVAQREHYIAGSCLTAALRWIRRRPPNLLLAAAAGAAAATTVVLHVADQRLAANGTAIVTAALAALFPWGLPIRGTPPLRLTRRATTLSVIALVMVIGAVAAVGVAVGWVPAVAIVACVTPLGVDAAAMLAAPLERRALERHRRTAEARLRQVAPFVIAITGSWGKTSTKNHVRDLIAGSAEVVSSPASWNNTAGLSRTMNEHLTNTTDVLVAEMGTYGPGEIRDMCSWIKPDIAVICAIGPMHLERMGSIEGIVEAKAEILERAKTAVLWVDNPHLANLAATTSVDRLIRVGSRGGSDLDVEVEAGPEDITVWVSGEEIGSYPVDSGAHPGNVACAVAAAHAFGVPAAQLTRRLPMLSNPSHRATVATSDAGVVVIDDTFNSNPIGARTALDTLVAAVPGRRVVVTPGMVELGAIQDQENEQLASAVRGAGATLVAVGWTNRTALQHGGGPDTVVVANRDEARAWVHEHLHAGDGVLWENDLPDHYP